MYQDVKIVGRGSETPKTIELQTRLKNLVVVTNEFESKYRFNNINRTEIDIYLSRNYWRQGFAIRCNSYENSKCEISTDNVSHVWDMTEAQILYVLGHEALHNSWRSMREYNPIKQELLCDQFGILVVDKMMGKDALKEVLEYAETYSKTGGLSHPGSNARVRLVKERLYGFLDEKTKSVIYPDVSVLMTDIYFRG